MTYCIIKGKLFECSDGSNKGIPSKPNVIYDEIDTTKERKNVPESFEIKENISYGPICY